ncbi:DUF4271 domain-containing protein [Cecembia sp.]|uniref:DUF4271 domain-containing protein n=1 Tax=Cecembia sp. TaxID=1898110 RepID=UPI0025BECB84|nr:DUF4271 domain-containing protein [Cecembia sp.]
MKKVGVWIFFFLSQIFLAHGQVIENYQQDISISKEKGFFNRNSSAKVNLDIINFQNSEFLFEIPQGTTLFIDEQLWMLVEKDTSIIIGVKGLIEKFKVQDKSKITFEVFGPDLPFDDLKVYKGFFSGVSEKTAASGISMLEFEKRQISEFEDFFIIALVIMLFLFAIFKVVFPTVFGFVVRPKTVFTAEDFSDSGSVQKFFTLDVLFYLFIINLGISLFAMLYFKVLGSDFMIDLSDRDINSLFFIWLLGAIFLALLSLFKFLFLKVMVFLFDLNKYDFAHFFYLLRIISISILLMLGISVYFYLNERLLLEPILFYALRIFFWIYLMGILLMFIIMVNRVPFKNYHLFAYICTAELIPFLILVKVLIG